MSRQIIGLAPGLIPTLTPWLSSEFTPENPHAIGALVRQWAQQQCDQVVADLFGYHALQMGHCALATLRNSRMTHRWICDDEVTQPECQLYANACALPFFEATLDLVTLPFTLDAHSDPDAVLNEVARTLVSQGHAIFIGFNKPSFWQAKQRLGAKILPQGIEIYGKARLQTKLKQLGLIVKSVQTNACLHHSKHSFWHSYKGLYCLVAQKRTLLVKPIYRKKAPLPSWTNLALVPQPKSAKQH